MNSTYNAPSALYSKIYKNYAKTIQRLKSYSYVVKTETKKDIFIHSYYRQLSADIKMKD